VSGSITGLLTGVTAWISVAVYMGQGVVDVHTLAHDYAFLAGNIIALTMSAVVCVGVSMYAPQRYDWDVLRQATDQTLLDLSTRGPKPPSQSGADQQQSQRGRRRSSISESIADWSLSLHRLNRLVGSRRGSVSYNRDDDDIDGSGRRGFKRYDGTNNHAGGLTNVGGDDCDDERGVDSSRRSTAHVDASTHSLGNTRRAAGRHNGGKNAPTVTKRSNPTPNWRRLNTPFVVKTSASNIITNQENDHHDGTSASPKVIAVSIKTSEESSSVASAQFSPLTAISTSRASLSNHGSVATSEIVQQQQQQQQQPKHVPSNNDALQRANTPGGMSPSMSLHALKAQHIMLRHRRAAPQQQAISNRDKRNTVIVSISLTLLILVAWPLLSLPQPVFSRAYFGFWVSLAFISVHMSAVVTIFLPLWEARRFILRVLCKQTSEKASSSVGENPDQSRGGYNSNPDLSLEVSTGSDSHDGQTHDFLDLSIRSYCNTDASKHGKDDGAHVQVSLALESGSSRMAQDSNSNENNNKHNSNNNIDNTAPQDDVATGTQTSRQPPKPQNRFRRHFRHSDSTVDESIHGYGMIFPARFDQPVRRSLAVLGHDGLIVEEDCGGIRGAVEREIKARNKEAASCMARNKEAASCADESSDGVIGLHQNRIKMLASKQQRELGTVDVDSKKFEEPRDDDDASCDISGTVQSLSLSIDASRPRDHSNNKPQSNRSDKKTSAPRPNKHRRGSILAALGIPEIPPLFSVKRTSMNRSRVSSEGYAGPPLAPFTSLQHAGSATSSSTAPTHNHNIIAFDKHSKNPAKAQLLQIMRSQGHDALGSYGRRWSTCSSASLRLGSNEDITIATTDGAVVHSHTDLNDGAKQHAPIDGTKHDVTTENFKYPRNHADCSLSDMKMPQQQQQHLRRHASVGQGPCVRTEADVLAEIAGGWNAVGKAMAIARTPRASIANSEFVVSKMRVRLCV
jgi:hypothetical protein